MLSGRGLCDELITRPEESYRVCCVVVCDLETSRIGAPYIYDISSLRVNENCISVARDRSVVLSYPCHMQFRLFLFPCPNNIKLRYGTQIENLKCLHTSYNIQNTFRNSKSIFKSIINQAV